MRLICAKDYEDVSRKAANIIAAQIQLKPDCVLGLATGSSPIGTYKQLIAKYESGDLDFSKVRTVNLDEYVGLTKDHDQSYAYFMRTNLFDHVNIDQANCNIPNGMNPDAEAECARYDAVIDSFGGADLQLLGLGPNGHIGFNEPSDSFVKNTNKVKLTDSTIDANQRFFEKREDVPTHAYTMGIGGNLDENSVLEFQSFDPKQHFTQPPAHYTEASLVRAMEELGIGRPSTYAPTITTILARRYIAKENRNLYVTELGEVVNNMMKEAFPSIVDVNFTANMEALLDGVEEGTVKWKTIVSNFYPDLDEAVKKAEKDLAEVTIADEESDEVCELCGRRMVIKYGPHGRFLACPGFPECRNTKPYFEKIGVACPKCGKDIVMKKTKKGRKYYGCIDNPECDFMVWQKPSGEKCPRCGKLLLEKGNKLVCMDEQCGYVKNKPTEEK